MSEELLIAHCSPTMAGLKTGSLFTCPMQSRAEILTTVEGSDHCPVLLELDI